MGAPEYEIAKEYQILGIKVFSEVVKDEDKAEFRALVFRSSCASNRWGTRTQDHSLTHYKNGGADFAKSVEQVRIEAAETLVKTEKGELPERSPGFLGVEIHGPTGKKVNTKGLPDLSLSPSLLAKEVIEMLELQPDGTYFYQEVVGETRRIPLFRAKITCGAFSAETSVARSNHGSPPLILGGDFFQKAMRGKEDVIQELIMPDNYRALANAARCKKTYVVVAGKYGEHRTRLVRIKGALASAGFVGLILDEYPDIEEQNLLEKFVTFASICRFVLFDDPAASGHNVELEICNQRKFTAAVLRHRGRASTVVQADVADEVSFIREFNYDSENQIENCALEAARWADDFVSQRGFRLNREYSGWRGPNKIMGN